MGLSEPLVMDNPMNRRALINGLIRSICVFVTDTTVVLLLIHFWNLMWFLVFSVTIGVMSLVPFLVAWRGEHKSRPYRVGISNDDITLYWGHSRAPQMVRWGDVLSVFAPSEDKTQKRDTRHKGDIWIRTPLSSKDRTRIKVDREVALVVRGRYRAMMGKDIPQHIWDADRSNEGTLVLENPHNHKWFILVALTGIYQVSLGIILLFLVKTIVELSGPIFFWSFGGFFIVLAIGREFLRRPTSVTIHEDGIILRFRFLEERTIRWGNILWINPPAGDDDAWKGDWRKEGLIRANERAMYPITFKIRREIDIHYYKKMGRRPMTQSEYYRSIGKKPPFSY